MKQFLVEEKQLLNEQDHLFINMLYTPIIGCQSTMLFTTLHNYSQLFKNDALYIKWTEIMSILKISFTELSIERSKLEAVGLIRVYESADETKEIISINKPLNPLQFKNNSLLYREFMKNIKNEELFEKIFFNTKFKEFVKDDFKETTVKFQDIFSLSFEKDKPADNTLEISLGKYENVDDAIKGCSTGQFINFLTNVRASESQLAMCQRLLSLGFSSRALNLIIKYSYDINDRIVSNHIETIANDLYKKNIIEFSSVESEMSSAKSFRESTQLDDSLKFEQQKINYYAEEELLWDDIFDLEGEK